MIEREGEGDHIRPWMGRRGETRFTRGQRTGKIGQLSSYLKKRREKKINARKKENSFTKNRAHRPDERGKSSLSIFHSVWERQDWGTGERTNGGNAYWGEEIKRSYHTAVIVRWKRYQFGKRSRIRNSRTGAQNQGAGQKRGGTEEERFGKGILQKTSYKGKR